MAIEPGQTEYVERSAELSLCGRFRYALWREWRPTCPDRRTVVFVGVNPSTADGQSDDATIRKMVGFAQRWRCNRMGVVNLFAYRATDVRELANAYRSNGSAAIVGPENNNHFVRAIRDADLVVPCWGSLAKIPRQIRWRAGSVRAQLREMKCKHTVVLGLTKGGDPFHPLMLPYSTPTQEWVP